MLDTRLRSFVAAPLDASGRFLAGLGVTANGVSALGAFLSVGCGVSIATGHFRVGLILGLLNRLADGLDGAVARAASSSDFGGYLDIVADFGFYLTIPVGFALASPNNALAALLLLASFTLTGVSFLAYAAIAAQRGDETDQHGVKAIFYSSGLAEGSETILAFALMCLFPQRFPLVAGIFTAMCLATVTQRSIAAKRHLAACQTKEPHKPNAHAVSGDPNL